MKQDINKKSFKDILWKYLCSMKVGIILLIIVAALSIIGTLIPQGAQESVYFHEYGETYANIILISGMNNVFEAWWYLFVGGLLCINILACTINRFPGIYRSVFSPKKILSEQRISNLKNNAEIKVSLDSDKVTEKTKNILEQEGFYAELTDKNTIYATKSRVGYFGSFVTHISFLILILAFMYGNLTGFEDSVGGVPGEIVRMDYADFDLKVDDFRIDYRDDYSVDQYYSDLTLLENDEETRNETIYVNKPLRHEGLNFYQSSYGWVGMLRIEDEENFFLDTVQMFEDRSYRYHLENLTVHLEAFYPDFAYDDSGHPVNRSPYPNNPRFIWYLLDENGEFLDMIVSEKGETFEYENVEFTFSDYDQYTVLRVVRDPSIPIFYFGSALMMGGLVLSFFFSPRRIWAITISGENNETKLLLGGQSFKSKVQFEEDFKEITNIIKDKMR